MKSLMLILILIMSATVYSQDTERTEATLQQALNPVQLGELLAFEQFDNADDYEPFIDDFAHLRVEDGQYLMEYEGDSTIVWESIEENHDNVVIEVTFTFDNMDASQVAGIICRTQSFEDAEGYYFEISPFGDYYISKYDGEEFIYMEEGWHDNLIQEANLLTVVCVDDYLALYANGVLLSEIVDTTYSKGFTTWSASLYEEDLRLTVTVDDVTVWSASLDPAHVMQQPLPDLSAGEIAVEPNRHLLYESFEIDTGWYLYQTDDTHFRVEDGVYMTEIEGDIASWASPPLELDNAIIEVDIQQLDGSDLNSMGLQCRTQDDGSAYRFWIAGDNLYNIARWDDDERTNLLEDPPPLTTLQETNTMTVVCVNDYLAMYVNGELIAEARDKILTRGYNSMVIALVEEEDTLQVQFDNLNIWTVKSP